MIKLINICITLCLINGGNSQDDDNMSYINLAMEAFSPCPDGFISMMREIGRRPSEENYWTGRVNLDKYKNIPEARIKLTVDTPAVLTIDPDIARVSSNGNTFQIIPFSVNDVIIFDVKASQKMPFPNIVSVKLNGKSVCKNPKKITPTMLGANPIAIGTNTPSQTDFTSHCGRRKIEHVELIVRGKATKPGDWPWHVALYMYNNQKTVQTYKCGGSLISSRTVVTAAHCVTIKGEKIASDLMTVTMGKYNLKTRDTGSQEREILNIYVYREFDIKTLRHDIAIMRLLTEVTFDQYIQPICLWSETDTAKEKIFGLQGTVVGWGLNENDTLSDDLKAGNMTIASDTECLLSHATFFQMFLHNGSFCAGNGRFGNANACNGDSGGGLVIPMMQIDGKNAYTLRGIVSLSVTRRNEAKCDPDYNVVYTDVAKYLDWINQYK